MQAGFVTEAARRGETAFRIMATTRHRSTESLKGYIRPAADGGRRTRRDRAPLTDPQVW